MYKRMTLWVGLLAVAPVAIGHPGHDIHDPAAMLQHAWFGLALALPPVVLLIVGIAARARPGNDDKGHRL